ncbi:MAG: 5-histidylcysteine sulfoxide synthase [Chitinophagales bacterium]
MTTGSHTKTINLSKGKQEEKRQEILEYFHQSFSLYESIFECLSEEKSYYVQANPLRHPLIFYYGHTAVFFINKLRVAGFINHRIDEDLESKLAIGVDEMSWDDLNIATYEWPSVAAVKAYRDKTRTVVDSFIKSCDISLPINWNDPLWIVMMGIEHERIHLETTSVLIRELPLHLVQKHDVWGNICKKSDTAPQNELLDVKAGKISLGKDKDNTFYGWDNEYGVKEFDVKDFKASKYLVSNQEFLAFIEDNGYHTPTYWDKEGLSWLTYRKAEYPVYWLKEKGQYKYRTMLKVIDMPWDWPVNINYLEAKAFCNWKSQKTGENIRMPSEAEWYHLRSFILTDQPDWNTAPGNINLEGYMSSCPINNYPPHQGFYDIIGNVWQWTETPLDAYEGFKVHPAYDDFSTPTFDGKHNVFKGGCWISTGNYALKDARYAFRRHFFQHAGLRYVVGEMLQKVEMNICETEETVTQYLEFHYGNEYFGVANFPVTCVQNALQFMANKPKQRALDIGCAAGRASFELAKVFDRVDAVDFSARLIEGPTNLQKAGLQRYAIKNEGELVTFKSVKLADFEGYENIKHKVQFMQGDACNLHPKYTNYNLVFAANLLDKLYDPAKFLNFIKSRLVSGGLLILASPYTWSEKFTEREKWLGGFKAKTGESYLTLEGLHDALTPDFKMLGNPLDIPFVIRETSRKFQHNISQMTVWEKL